MKNKKTDVPAAAESNLLKPVKEVLIAPENNSQNTQKPVQESTQKGEPSLIVKSGDTDLRRGVKGLSEVVEKRMGLNPHNGDMYMFSNNKNEIKILQKKEGGILLLTKKNDNPIKDYPEYKPRGEKGYTAEYKGKDRERFLEKMGFPKNL